MSNKIFCFGYGYTCDHLGRMLQDKGNWSIAGTTRDLDKQALMRKNGIKAFIFDYHKPLGDPSLFFDGITHLLLSAPPSDSGDPVFETHAADILAIKSLQWVGYLSSTVAYGDHDGEWVDETAELFPDSIRASRRIKAEQQWHSLFVKHSLPMHIFRIAGIYGPGRSALDSVRAGVARRIEKPGHVFNRVHVDDIIQTLYASMQKPNPGSIYNICDDLPTPSHEVITYACKKLGIKPPPMISFEQADMSPMARSFYMDNKRTCNDKIKQELGVNLLYPDYKTGLDACMVAEKPSTNIASNIAS